MWTRLKFLVRFLCLKLIFILKILIHELHKKNSLKVLKNLQSCNFHFKNINTYICSYYITLCANFYILLCIYIATNPTPITMIGINITYRYKALIKFILL